MFDAVEDQANNGDAEIASNRPSETEGGEPSTSWDGRLDEEELLRPGGMLLAALVRRAAERRQTMKEMAERLGVTYAYVCHLRNGLRKVTSISEAFTLGCALYLGVPRVTVLVMAGKLAEQDFYELNEVPAQDLDSAMELLARDAKFGTLLTAEIQDGSVQTRYAFVRFYEEATGKRLLPERIDLRRIIDSVCSVEAIRQERIAQLKAMRVKETPANTSSGGAGKQH